MAFARVNIPIRRLCGEAGKKTFVCLAAALAIGAALPYSMGFAFQTVTHLAFAVAFTEGAISVLADLLDSPDYALKKTLEGTETLAASVLLAAVTLGIGSA